MHNISLITCFICLASVSERSEWYLNGLYHVTWYLRSHGPPLEKKKIQTGDMRLLNFRMPKAHFALLWSAPLKVWPPSSTNLKVVTRNGGFGDPTCQNLLFLSGHFCVIGIDSLFVNVRGEHYAKWKQDEKTKSMIIINPVNTHTKKNPHRSSAG